MNLKLLKNKKRYDIQYTRKTLTEIEKRPLIAKVQHEVSLADAIHP